MMMASDTMMIATLVTGLAMTTALVMPVAMRRISRRTRALPMANSPTVTSSRAQTMIADITVTRRIAL